MSYYDDYVAEGLCCESCGAYLDGNEPGYSRFCYGCQKARDRETAKLNKRARK